MHQAAPVQPSPVASLAAAIGELLLALRLQLDDSLGFNPTLQHVSERRCLVGAACKFRCKSRLSDGSCIAGRLCNGAMVDYLIGRLKIRRL